MSTPIVPALIPKSRAEVLAAAELFSFSPEFHLDVVDGVFVPNVSWPIQPADEPIAVSRALAAYSLEVDLMVSTPITAAETWVVAGADMLVFHVETLTLEEFAQFVEYTSVTVGVAASGTTPLSTLIEYAALADYVQLMGIYEIGVQGQPFNETVLKQISEVKKAIPGILVSIDGSVNKDTVLALTQAGADRLVCGSAIVGAPDPALAYTELQALIN